MELPIHNINSLFEQLGLDNSDEAVEAFINDHKSIPRNLHLHEAEFWTPSQSAFLEESVTDDADWAEIVDQLDARLRE